MSRILIWLSLLAATLFSTALHAHQKPALHIAVSANFSAPFLQLKPALEAFCSCDVSHTFGSSGLLASQFNNGAPYDLFLSADSEKPQWLYRQGRTLFEPITYAVGQLILVDKHRNSLSFDDLAISHNENRSLRLAIANAKTAPYGTAAEQVLSHVNIRSEVSVVKGNSVLQALQYVITGNADQAIVSHSLAANALEHGLSFLSIPEHLHQPIYQQLVISKKVPFQTAQRLMAFFQLNTTQQMLAEWGYKPLPLELERGGKQ